MTRTKRPFLVMSAIAIVLCQGVATAGAQRGARGHGFPYAQPKKANAKCFLSIGPRTYINGPCTFTPSGKGSFEFDDNKTKAFCYHRENDCGMAALTIEQSGYFGSLDVDSSGVGAGYWNEGEGLHGQSRLGDLRRNGACWLTDPSARPRVKLCVWR